MTLAWNNRSINPPLWLNSPPVSLLILCALQISCRERCIEILEMSWYDAQPNTQSNWLYLKLHGCCLVFRSSKVWPNSSYSIMHIQQWIWWASYLCWFIGYVLPTTSWMIVLNGYISAMWKRYTNAATKWIAINNCSSIMSTVLVLTIERTVVYDALQGGYIIDSANDFNPLHDSNWRQNKLSIHHWPH